MNKTHFSTENVSNLKFSPQALLVLLASLLLLAGPALAGHHGKHDEHEGSKNGKCSNVISNGDQTIVLGPLGSRSYLGVELTSLTPELRRHFGAPEDEGVMISRVDDDSPALAAGLRVGDILTAVDGEGVSSAGQLARAVRGHEGGEMIELEYLREGTVERTEAVLGERENCVVDVSRMIPDGIHVQGLEALEAIDWGQIGALSSDVVEQALSAAHTAMEGQDWEAMAEQWEEWGERYAEEWEEWGEKFGEEFGEKFSEQWNEEYMEKLELRMEELERQLENLEVEMENNFEFDIDPEIKIEDDQMNI